MTLTVYVFAFYVFLLVCASVWFFSKMTRSKKKQDNSNYEKEQRIFKLYQNVEDMMTSFEEYIEEARSEINQKIAEASSLLEEAKSIKRPVKLDIAKREEPINEIKNRTHIAGLSASKNNNAITKDMILGLMDDGMDEDQIAKELGISRREVSLFKVMKKIEVKN